MSRLVPDSLSETRFDYETLLDVTVNLVPMGILAFFVGVYLVFAPLSQGPFVNVLSHALTILPLVFLGLLTYVAATVLADDDDRSGEAPPGDAMAPGSKTAEAVRAQPETSADVPGERADVTGETDRVSGETSGADRAGGASDADAE